jgi:hypothetical protein
MTAAPAEFRRLGKHSVTWDDPRDPFIRQYACGKTFVDAGGIESCEKVSVAHKAGAESLTILDIESLERPSWDAFRDKMTMLGIEVECISADVHKVARTWEVVHSSGILYHESSPFLYLDVLRRMATECCILSSTVVPPLIETASGTLRTPEAGVLLIPALTGVERKIVSELFRGINGRDVLVGPHLTTTGGYGPNWWFPTSAALRKMCECAGFEILEAKDWPTEVHPAITLVLHPVQ